jgi:hypothetical protein
MRADCKGRSEVRDSLFYSLVSSLFEIVGKADRTPFSSLRICFVTGNFLQPCFVIVFMVDDPEIEMFCNCLQIEESLLCLLWRINVAVTEKKHWFIAEFSEPFYRAGGTRSTTAME